MDKEDEQVSPKNWGLDEFRMLNPVSKKAMYLSNGIKIAILAAIYIGIFRSGSSTWRLPSSYRS